MSEPKTPDDDAIVADLPGGWPHPAYWRGYHAALRLVLQSFGLEVDPDRPGVAAVALRVEDKVQQQERARVRELCDAAKATGMALEMARVREVFMRMREEMRWLGVYKRCPVECWARELGIDLEGTDD